MPLLPAALYALKLMYVDAAATVPDLALNEIKSGAGHVATLTRVDALKGTAGPPVHLKPDDIHRTLVFIVDDLSLTPATAKALRATLHQAVELQLQPTDQLAVVTASGGPATALTSDKSALAAAIDRIHSPPAEVPADVAVAAPKSALRFALLGLREVLGRKAVVVFSTNPLLFDKPLSNVQDNFPERAARAAAVVYGVNMTPDTSQPYSLGEFAAQTGGLVLSGDPAAAIAAVLHDQEAYYLIGYEAEESASRLELSSTRAGVELRARDRAVGEDLFAANGRTWTFRPPGSDPSADLLRGIISPIGSNTLAVSFAATHAFGKSGPELDMRALVDGAGIALTHTVQDRWIGAVDVRFALLNADGETLFNTANRYPLDLDRIAAGKLRATGLDVRETIQLTHAGGYDARLSVRDATSGATGSVSAFTYAPVFQEGGLLVTGILINDQDRSGQRFSYSYQIAGLKTDEQKRSAAEARVTILSEGRTLYEGKAIRLDFSPSDSDVRSATAHVDVNGDLGPGRYVLRITVTDKLAPSLRTATQGVAFEVR